jgi:hypothetical protein
MNEINESRFKSLVDEYFKKLEDAGELEFLNYLERSAYYI